MDLRRGAENGAGRARIRSRLKKALFLAPALFLIPLVLYCLAALREAVRALALRRTDALLESLGPLKMSLLISLMVTALSLLIGLPFAYLFSRTNLVRKRALIYGCCLPLFIPPYVQAYAWIFLLGKRGIINHLLMMAFSLERPPLSIYGVPGTIWILTLSYFPVLMCFLYAGLESWAPSLEEAGSLHYPRLRVARSVTLPLVAPYLLSGLILTFLFSLAQFSVPALLEVRTFSVDLFVQVSAFFDDSAVLLKTLPLMVLVGLLLIWLLRTAEKGYFSPSHLGHHPDPVRLAPGSQFLGAGFALSLIVVSVLLPVGAVLYQSGGAGIVLKTIGESRDAILFSLGTAAAAASGIALVSVLLTSFVKDAAFERHLRMAALSLLMIPGTLLGLGMIQALNHRWSVFIYSSPAVLVMTYFIQFLPYGWLAVSAGRKQIDGGLREAASLSGASRLATFRKITFPHLRPSLSMAWLIAFSLCLGELTATILVIPAGRETLSLRIFSLMHYGESGMIAAAALLPLLLSTGGWLLFRMARTLGKALT